MSWLKSAVNRAVAVSGKNNLSRTVRNYADSVVFQAGNVVVEGAKILQDRMGPKNLKSCRHMVKRLEELSVSCRGIERVQLLRRWLVALKEIERVSSAYPNDTKNDDRGQDDDHSQIKPMLVYYVDPGPNEPMNFRDVFLLSQALEGMTLSMILGAPNEEEASLLLEIFGLCLTGGREIHNAVMSSIQDLAKAFVGYQDEVLAKREELLNYAQSAIAGLKINANISRIDAEVRSLMEKLDKMKAIENISPANNSRDTTSASVEALQEALEHIGTCSKLEAVLLKKKYSRNGDSPKQHAEKVDKLKVLSESLMNSTSKAERRILEHRTQKEEALVFRVAKTNEVNQQEKELAAEVRQLERQKEELEAELKKANTSLLGARARLHNAREEREQFDEASNQLLIHLKSKEDELSRSIASCKAEAEVVNRWINFLEDTWTLQTAHTEQKDKQVNGELDRYGINFVNLVTQLLSAYKDQLEPCITKTRNIVENLLSNQRSGTSIYSNDQSTSTKSKKYLEEEYLNLETKFVTTLSVVDSMKKQFYQGFSRKDDQRVKELFDALENIKEEFESIERPVLEIESPTRRSHSPAADNLRQSLFNASVQAFHSGERKLEEKSRPSSFKIRSSSFKEQKVLVVDDLDYDDGGYCSAEEDIGEWEFDELAKDHNTGG